ncbi:hypothetical protein CKM354_000417600 [Cercospora kikuchii]|uniref:DUF6590 domain-containing protein n=1 Tax=Cercospora kikuchii TaxID=84275 RepID=A0A9P3CAZ7_9PEZI|nr:uncharacterized protein CKM354_000417600 [Cercospora kikuchii]GIZ40854.1 hypothetical protein CKM354_000417600 [Cercospora kikuchii]
MPPSFGKNDEYEGDKENVDPEAEETWDTEGAYPDDEQDGAVIAPQPAPVQRYQFPGSRNFTPGALTRPANEATQLRCANSSSAPRYNLNGSAYDQGWRPSESRSSYGQNKQHWKPAKPILSEERPARTLDNWRPSRTTLTTQIVPSFKPNPATPLLLEPNAVLPSYKSSGRTWQDFRLGDVLWAEHSVHSTIPTVTNADLFLCHTADGPKIFKVRLHVCIKKMELHMVCLPMYSHGDNGISRVPKERWYEYSCVGQIGEAGSDRHPLGFTSLGFESDDPTFKLRDTSTVRLVEPRSILYDQPITKVGRIVDGSMEILSSQSRKAEEEAERKFHALTVQQQREAKDAKNKNAMARMRASTSLVPKKK